MLLRLVRGATAITLSGDGATIAGCTYTPRAPELDERELSSILRSGGEVTLLARRNVTESVSVILVGAAGQIRSQAQQLEALFPVEEAQRRPGTEPVYVEFRADDSSDVYRSEILAGRVEWPDRPLGRRLAAGAVELVIIWKRRYYWEDTILRDVPLSNGNGSNVVGGLPIYNHNDGGPGHDNFVDIAGSAVGGVIPAACRIVLTNSSGANVAYGRIFIAQNVLSAPADFAPILEGEDNEVGGGSVTNDATSSNGKYFNIFWASGSDPTIVRYRWTLPGARLLQANGGYFRVLCRFAVTPNDSTFVRLRLLHQSVYELQETGEIQLEGRRLQALDVLQLPPALYGLPTLGDLQLTMQARSSTAGSLSVDFLQLSPLDGWRELETLGGTYADGTQIVDDGISGLRYTDEGGGAVYANLIARGAPIHLWPGMDQRLSVLFDEGAAMHIDRQSTVQIQVRPRRLTI